MTTPLMFLCSALSASTAAPTSAEILTTTYDRASLGPPGFYVDPDQVAGKTLVAPCDETKCATDDRARARQLARTDLKANFKKSGDIEAERETPKYFDFLSGGIWYRVHRPSYFAWAGRSFNPALSAPPNGTRTLGALKDLPVSEAAAREFAEYHWFVSTVEIGGRKVAKVEAHETPDRWQVTLYVVWATTDDFGETDRLTPVATTYEVDKGSGVVTVETKQLETIAGRTHAAH